MINPRLREFVNAMSLESSVISKAPPDQGGNAGGSQDCSIEELVNCWRINGVSYRNGIYQVDASKTLLPEGTQKEHAQRRKEALTNNGFYTPDYPLFHGVMNALYQNREGSFNGKIEEARTSFIDFLSNFVKNRWLTTLTRIRYAPHGQDLVIHNCGQDDEYEVPSNFVGPSGDITKPETNAGTALQALLGTQQSPQEINQVYGWFRDTDYFLARIGTRPQEITEEMAIFVTRCKSACFDCFGDPLYPFPSLGVRAEKIR
jgi:hypothetical protein